MKNTKSPIVLALLAASAFSSIAFAEGVYMTGQIGQSYQATDNEAYGNNIAVDPDFPSQFDAEYGAVGSMGIGYAISDNYRVESRLGFREADFNDRQVGTGSRDGEEYILNGALKSTTLTIEGFYDIDLNSDFTPYVKAGVGVAFNNYSAKLGGAGVAAFDPFDGNVDGYYDAYSDNSSTEFTWNLGLGGSYAVNDQVNIIAEYQYISLGDVQTGQDDFTDGFQIDGATANEVSIGVRYNF